MSRARSRTLEELQADMAAALVGGAVCVDGEIVPGGTLSLEGALDVYRRGYVVRLTEQLGETYEAVWWLLGDQMFFDVCRRFIERTPSASYNLTDYGEGFADFLTELQGRPELEVLPELARLEWRFKELFHRPEHRHVQPQQLAALGDLTGVRFVLGEAVELIDSAYAVGEIFSRRSDPPDPSIGIDWRRPQHILLYKLDGQVYLREVEPAAMAVLKALAAGRPIEEALSAGLDSGHPFGEEQAAQVFEMLARCGLVESVAAD